MSQTIEVCKIIFRYFLNTWKKLIKLSFEGQMTFITHIFVFYFIIYLYIYYNILFYVGETSIVMPSRLKYSYHHNFGSINNIHSEMVKKRCFMELGWVTCILHLKGLKSNLSCPEFLPWLFPFPVGFHHPPIFQIASPHDILIPQIYYS